MRPRRLRQCRKARLPRSGECLEPTTPRESATPTLFAATGRLFVERTPKKRTHVRRSPHQTRSRCRRERGILNCSRLGRAFWGLWALGRRRRRCRPAFVILRRRRGRDVVVGAAAASSSLQTNNPNPNNGSPSSPPPLPPPLLSNSSSKTTVPKPWRPRTTTNCRRSRTKTFSPQCSNRSTSSGASSEKSLPLSRPCRAKDLSLLALLRGIIARLFPSFLSLVYQRSRTAGTRRGAATIARPPPPPLALLLLTPAAVVMVRQTILMGRRRTLAEMGV